MSVTGNNRKKVPGCWFQNPMYRVPGNCGKFCFRIMEGLRYNRAVRMHKLAYEALMRLARSGFSTWVTLKHNEKESVFLPSLPWSLAATDDSLKNTLKTFLAKESALHGSV